MKTEFLKSLGITDQDTIDSIMAENGRDITKVRRELDSANAKVEGLQSQLDERDNQLKELKKTVDKNTDVARQLEELQAANTQMKSDYENKLATMQRDNEIEGKLRDANAKNVKAAKALLDLSEGAPDIDSQITALKAAENSSFLFGVDSTKQPPAGSTPAGAKIGGEQHKETLTLTQLVANKLSNK